MENSVGKNLREKETDPDMPVTLWTIDRSKCNVCGECVDACLRGLLKVVDKRIIITSQIDCNWCGDCAGACASDAIELT